MGSCGRNPVFSPMQVPDEPQLPLMDMSFYVE
jgi:hypothetical protein